MRKTYVRSRRFVLLARMLIKKQLEKNVKTLCLKLRNGSVETFN